VTRRYKQFDWLYQRLTDKFSTVAVPPLPGKQITGLHRHIYLCMALQTYMLTREALSISLTAAF